MRGIWSEDIVVDGYRERDVSVCNRELETGGKGYQLDLIRWVGCIVCCYIVCSYKGFFFSFLPPGWVGIAVMLAGITA